MVRNPADNVLTHNAILVLVSCALLYFITLGAREVQPWDEALYATRARAVSEKHAVWDQSPLALGGAQTAVDAPLNVWVMSQFIGPMKMTPLSVRLFSVLCAIAALFLLYDIACLMLPRKTAILAPVLLCASIGWNHFARLGMPDVPMLTNILLALFAVLRAMNEADGFRRLLWLALYTTAVALALLCKLSASFIALSFIALPWLQQRFYDADATDIENALSHFASHSSSSSGIARQLSALSLLTAALLGIALAAPWYGSMMMQHPQEFWQSALSALHPTEFPPLQRWIGSALHRLIVQQPLSVFALAWIGYGLRRKALLFRHSLFSGLEVLLALWLGLTLVVLTALPLKSDTYVLLCLPPAVLLSLRGMEVLMQYSSRSRAGVLTYTLGFVAVLWSLAAPLRISSLALLHGNLSAPAIGFLLVVVAALALGLTGKADRRLARSVMMYRAFHSVVPIVLVLRIAALNIWSVDEAERGAQKCAKWLHDTEGTEFVYITHKTAHADSLCPQLSWYTKGWAGYATSPWETNKHYRYVLLKPGVVDSTAIELLYAENVPIVYERPDDDSLMAWDSRYLSRFQTLRLRTQNYIVFSRRGYAGTMEGLDTELRMPERDDDAAN